ncbi:SRPBCC domain-containing protein [Kutzneria chonburiensis]|uniref:SRPBCC domain-containing protein n=1 Tax=Kutzneria chonburiensis TaxID=1483604 RepID=A0ABV6N7J4_9PSEU|nr:SRPBCC domain-containing protein [Kutzneria chonburiensis]
MDDIEREIAINAPVERVWELVSQGGWWIGDGDRGAQTRSREGDDVDVVVDPRYGTFRIRTEKAEPHSYLSYRWLDDGNERATTLVEFWLSETDGVTTLRVVESGFVSAEHREGNIKGWGMQLAVAKAECER